jgi:hypothetical protein
MFFLDKNAPAYHSKANKTLHAQNIITVGAKMAMKRTFERK